MPHPKQPANLRDHLIQRGDMIFAIAVVTTVIFLVLPLPTMMIDLFLTVAMSLAFMIIMTVMYVKEPVQFAGFPTILLFVTLFRLALNVATTRSILDRADAGHLINAFGNFVIQGNFVVGIVIFLILITINFMVITKGSGRVAEVAARFTLDALPGKQMSIDADMNAGLLNEAEAKRRRLKLQEEADFYGAMDGASKFVRGDAVAGIIIILINILGGFAIGVLQKGFSFKDAAQHYTLLTVGDGLVTQIPALLISTAAGILVTRGASKEGLGQDIVVQFLSYHKGLYAVAMVMGLLALIPGFPWWAFLILATGFYLLGRMVEKHTAEMPAETTATVPGQEKAAKPSGVDKADEWLKMEPLQIEVGYNLVGLLDKAKGGDLVERVTTLRKSIASELGLIIAPIRIRDNPILGGNIYSILLRGTEIARGEIHPNHLLAMGVGTTARPLAGRVVTEPVFNLPATWILENERRNAEQLGFAIVDPISVLVTHLAETIRQHAHQLLTRQDTQNLLDQLKEVNAAVVTELIPNLVTIGIVHRTLQNLLREGVPIRNLGLILEKVADYAPSTKNPDELSEQARKALSWDLVRNVLPAGQNNLTAITLDPDLEQRLAHSVRQTQQDVTLALDPGLARHLFDQVSDKMKQMLNRGVQPLIVCSPAIRLALRRFFEGTFRTLTFLAYNELPEKTEIQSIAMVPNVA
ncbi:MAG: flagellar biosynthesis protein FlhA [Verrucomicrobia bacterium]|nr:flagellar biosynthesis protein FlhA [Verrucomicrobiota bacterium]